MASFLLANVEFWEWLGRLDYLVLMVAAGTVINF
jgi:hypothetical protein